MRDSAGGTELVICTATTAARPAGAALREDMNRVLVVQRDGPYLGGGGEADLERGAAGVGGVPSRTGSKRGGSVEGHQDKGRFPLCPSALSSPPKLVWTSQVHAQNGGPYTDWLYTPLPDFKSGLKKKAL